MNESVLLRFPPEIVRAALEVYRQRRRTVWDARRILSKLRDRWMKIEVEDGQFSDTELEGIFEDVVHHPQQGFSLVLRRVRPSRGIREASAPVTLPLKLIRRVPKPFLFLFRDPTEWPLPEPAVQCAATTCSEWVFGRFCSRCGTHSREGVGQRFCGEGFSSLQQALQAEGMPRCACGAAHLPSDRFCEKCGTSLANEEEE